jgi:endonuclease/exonuclease/phosphatase family metal-dependent hydrolase
MGGPTPDAVSGRGANGRLLVASYNVHRCVGADGRADASRIAAVLGEIGASVVGLQEVESLCAGQLDELARLTGLSGVAGPTCGAARRDFGNALLTSLPVAGVRRVDLSVPQREPRGLLDVELDWNGRPLHVLITHFGLSGAERRVQAMLTVGELHLNRAGVTILLGDFNEWLPGGRTLRTLEGRFGRHRSPRTFPARRPLFALDRIWVRPRGALGAIHTHRTRLARAASDHLPVVATLKLDAGA